MLKTGRKVANSHIYDLFNVKFVLYGLLQTPRGAQVFGLIYFVLCLGFDQAALGLLPLRLGIELVGEGTHRSAVTSRHHAQVLLGLPAACLGSNDEVIAIGPILHGLSYLDI